MPEGLLTVCANPTPPDYEAIEANMWRKNAKQVLPDLKSDDAYLLKRIETYGQKFGYGKKKIKKEIETNKMFAATFAKAPSRTGFHESIAAEWLRKELNLPIDVLPKAGTNSFYITSDGVIAQVGDDERKPSKSLDFQWQVGDITFYAMHKYTREGGGAQDNQFKEMLATLQNFVRATNKKKVFIVIADGAYYTKSKMDELESLTRNHTPKSFAVHIEDVPQIVAQYR